MVDGTTPGCHAVARGADTLWRSSGGRTPGVPHPLLRFSRRGAVFHLCRGERAEHTRPSPRTRAALGTADAA
eukprot:3371908-Pleurochrysis_carterae.AAC.1